MQSRKSTLARVILLSLFALLSSLITSCAAPVVAQDRVFLDLSLDFLGEYQLPKMSFLDTPFGGLSAIIYDRRSDRFYATADDNSRLAPARFYTLKLALNSTATEKIDIQKIDIESVTFLTDQEGKPYAKGTISPKGIALTPQKTVFISGYSATGDQIAPFVQEFNLKSGQMLQSLSIPERYLPKATDEKERTKGIQQTSAFASLTFNPTGTVPTTGEPINLFTATQSALLQDREPPGSQKGAKSRILQYLIGYGSPVLIAEYFYPLDPTVGSANGLVELLSVDHGGHFLSLECSREELGFKQKIFQITTGGATDTSRIDSLKGEIRGIQPVKKKLLLDLNELGIPLDNLQGMTLGPRLRDGSLSLLLVSDNNFNAQQTTQFLLFRLNTRSKDEADNHLIELAIAGNAKIIATNNIKDFKQT